MVTETTNEEKSKEKRVITTDYWVLPEESLEGWLPKTAFIDYRVFEGPVIGPRQKGLSLKKDLMGGAHGPRGSGKTSFITFLAMKKMRAGFTVYSNYPISFFVIEENGSLKYYESKPLDIEKMCQFHPDLRRVVIVITELQYYVEARTSGRLQNRMISYQIMQIRKTANSFFYDVQSKEWVDKRFAWSDDFAVFCKDMARLPYDQESVKDFPKWMLDGNGYLKEGAVVSLDLRDVSGILTGETFSESGVVYQGIQFFAGYIWDAFPTKFIIDAWTAYHSLNTEADKKSKEDDELLTALEAATSYFISQRELKVIAEELWAKTEEILGRKVNTVRAGKILKNAGVTKKPDGYGHYKYNLGELIGESGD